MEEYEDEVTGFSSGDMGLQARALYDYQAGKFHIDMYLSLHAVRMQICALYVRLAGKFHADMHPPFCDMGLQARVLCDHQAGQLHRDAYSSYATGL